MLTITFLGICGHYRDVVPGVPHRVVLPNASQIHMGSLTVLDQRVSYYLLPHYVMLRTGPGIPLTVPGIAKDGWVHSPVRLQVLNAVDQPLSYDASYDHTWPIEDFVPRFEYSQEVVLGGRAAAYFDIHGGVVSSSQGTLGARYTTIAIQTDGTPRLGLTPLGSATTVPMVIEDTLTVGNVDWDPGDEDGPFDFLLHYLAAERGIPETLSLPTPGMGLFPQSKCPLEIADALRHFADSIDTDSPSLKHTLRITPDVHYESCSDTRYP